MSVSINISLPPGDVAVEVEVSNHLAMAPGVSSESKEFNSDLDKEINGFEGLGF